LEPTRLARILAAANGSVAGRHAAEFARNLAHDLGTRIRLLSVATDNVPGYSGELSRTADSTGDGAAWVRGVPAIEIVRDAQQWEAGLIVIGRQSRAPLGEPMGRTAEAVVRRSSGPCLLVPPNVDRIGRILVALDGTTRGLRILSFAEMFTRSLEVPASTVLVTGDATGAENARSRVLPALLDYPDLGGPGELDVRIGPAVEQVLDALRTTRADLLVIGIRRGGQIGGAGSGHVGRDLLLRAPTAILTVPI
jgi:nucleotide-binding universal stress UspA family protein